MIEIMKFISIELVGFKRILLNNIHSFKMNITDPLQLILGSNGSGKSSMLDQLTPLPPSHTDFIKTGKKVITIESMNSLYILSSMFSPTQKHSFIKDNIELNDGGTITVQKELVKEHFLITPDIHELLIGRDTFDKMSFSKRKEWFIKLCDTNYDYAIKVYNQLKEKHRDTVGALKLAKKRLSIESEKIVKTDQEQELINSITELYAVLNNLLEFRKPIENDLQLIQINQSELDNELIKYTQSLNTLLVQKEHLSVSELDALILQSDKENYSINNESSKLFTKLNENNEKILVLQKAKESTIESLELELINLNNEKTKQLSSLIVPLQPNASVLYTSFDSVKTNLSDVFNTILDNTDKKYSQEQLLNAKQELAVLLSKKNTLDSNVESSQLKIKHMLEHKDHPDLSCPSCNHKFSLGYNEVIYNTTLSNIFKYQNSISELVIKEKQLIEYIDNCIEYANQYRLYIQTTKSLPLLNDYWCYLNDKNIITSNAKAGSNELNIITTDLRNQIRINELDNLIKSKLEIFESLKTLDGLDINYLINENKTIDTRLQELTQVQIKLHNQSKEYTNRRFDLLSVNQLVNKIKNTISEKKDLNKQSLETLRRTYLNKVINEFQSSLASKQLVLNNIKSQQLTIDDISSQVKQLEDSEKALSILVNQLSPTDGLIAEGLLGFISSFVEQMNYFISKIWSYPLVVQSCHLDTEVVDLDYKFPMYVGDKDNLVSDISKGSSGMLEVINLAFRVTCMKYLGMANYPLYLDEFGSRLDDAHRTLATNAIRSLVEQQTFNQLFVISHYEGFFGALANTQICVLDPTNIVLPRLEKQVNQHVQIM